MSRKSQRSSSKTRGSSNGKSSVTGGATNGRNTTNSRNEGSTTGNSNGASNAPDNAQENTGDDKGEQRGRERRNDPEWYARDPQLLADAARVPFSTPFGAPLSLIDSGSTTGGITISTNIDRLTSSPAGICSLRVTPTFGFAESRNDPINVAANALYAHIRSKNSGRKNYDPSDAMIYCLALADIYSAIIWCQRLYALAYMYSQKNYYIAEDIIRSNGVMPGDLKENLANFRYWLNAFINKVSSFACPADITYFRRRAFMFSNYYIENNYGNIKDQLYQFVPDGFYRFELDTRGIGSLQFQRWNGTVAAPSTIAQLEAYMESLLTYITGDEDFGLISGDILRAFEGNIITLSSQQDEAIALPIYDPYVLSQFKNTTVTGLDRLNTYTIGSDTFTYGNLYQQSNGDITYRAKCDDHGDIEEISCKMRRVLSVENPQPDIGDVIEASRLLASWNYQLNDGTIFCGTEVAVEEICVNRRGTILGWGSNYSITHTNMRVIAAADADNVYSGKVDWDTVMMSQFKYSPVIYALIELSATTYDGLQLISNVDNIALIDGDIIRRLHECALLSLFFVPGVAKLV